MVSENEQLQSQLKDTKMTLTQTKKSLAEVSNEIQNYKTIKIRSNDETMGDEPSIGKPYMQKINTVR